MNGPGIGCNDFGADPQRIIIKPLDICDRDDTKKCAYCDQPASHFAIARADLMRPKVNPTFLCTHHMYVEYQKLINEA
jgi:hypothetical protein